MKTHQWKNFADARQIIRREKSVTRNRNNPPRSIARVAMLAVLILGRASAADTASPVTLKRDDVLAETLRPYAGPSVHGVDVSTLTGKTMCGYQGWFNTEGDGMGRGFRHWLKGGGGFVPGNAKFDLWPDVSEFPPEERAATKFKHRDGRAAEVFSSFRRETVVRHFQWMREYGIDGAFVQRFVAEHRDPRALQHNNTVLAHCREGANRNGRAYAVMYDLSGLGAGRMGEVMDDWRELRTRMRIADDPAYERHRGKPLVAVWGMGFSDKGRAYTLGECRKLVEFLKRDGCSVLLGVPAFWRQQTGDAISDPALHDVLALADILSPWAVSRVRSPEDAAKQGEQLWKPDIAWCSQHHVDFLPVLFPGFSWHNMHGGPPDQIPRRKGAFFWSQFQAAKRAGATMAYVAMFDEVDEGTAIFKCTDDVTGGGGSEFVTLEGEPGDRYLRLAGAGAKMIRGELPADAPLPK